MLGPKKTSHWDDPQRLAAVDVYYGLYGFMGLIGKYISI